MMTTTLRHRAHRGVAGAVRIRLRIGDDVATATLEDSAPARDFAAMLPTTIRMHDLFGREKAGPLPRQLDIDGATRELDYQVGERGAPGAGTRPPGQTSSHQGAPHARSCPVRPLGCPGGGARGSRAD